MNIETTLNEAIEIKFEELKNSQVGTKEHDATVDALAKLMDRAIEIEQIKVQHEEKENDAERDQKDKTIKNCLTAASIGLPLLVTIWGTLKSFAFEKDGVVTTIMGKGFINKLLPKK